MLRLLNRNFNVLRFSWFCSQKITTSPSSDVPRIVIAGGGAGGISAAAKLKKQIPQVDITIIEPSAYHYYQPLWTLVGAGMRDFDESRRRTQRVIPRGVKWLKDEVKVFNPADDEVITEREGKINYDFLIVALGLKLAINNVTGLQKALETPEVCCNYSADTVRKTAKVLKSFRKGVAVFTQPVNPIKCTGAAQKIAYLAEEHFRRNGTRQDIDVAFYSALNTMFAVPKYDKVLRQIAARKHIAVHLEHSLVEVDYDQREAVFRNLMDSSDVRVHYDMLHVTPPMAAPDVLSVSDLSDSTGFLDINQFTLRHSRYANVFGIGDCINAPTSKTAAAVAAQCGILGLNVLSAIKDTPLPLTYDGYTSCPLVTGDKKGVLAEFDYSQEPLETFPIDQGKERYLFYHLKTRWLPYLYWHMLLKGRWEGPATMRKILHTGMHK